MDVDASMSDSMRKKVDETLLSLVESRAFTLVSLGIAFAGLVGLYFNPTGFWATFFALLTILGTLAALLGTLVAVRADIDKVAGHLGEEVRRTTNDLGTAVLANMKAGFDEHLRKPGSQIRILNSNEALGNSLIALTDHILQEAQGNQSGIVPQAWTVEMCLSVVPKERWCAFGIEEPTGYTWTWYQAEVTQKFEVTLPNESIAFCALNYAVLTEESEAYLVPYLRPGFALFFPIPDLIDEDAALQPLLQKVEYLSAAKVSWQPRHAFAGSVDLGMMQECYRRKTPPKEDDGNASTTYKDEIDKQIDSLLKGAPQSVRKSVGAHLLQQLSFKRADNGVPIPSEIKAKIEYVYVFPASIQKEGASLLSRYEYRYPVGLVVQPSQVICSITPDIGSIRAPVTRSQTVVWQDPRGSLKGDTITLTALQGTWLYPGDYVTFSWGTD